jgi:hypothetical protein
MAPIRRILSNLKKRVFRSGAVSDLHTALHIVMVDLALLYFCARNLMKN